MERVGLKSSAIFMRFHKGADGFFSDERFKKFYWPTLKQIIVGLIEGGCIPFPVLEGHWGSRLKVIQDIPKGETMWMADQTDMAKAVALLWATGPSLMRQSRRM
jgi:hypothetical protein